MTNRWSPQPGDLVKVERSTWSPVDATRALIGHVVKVEEVGPKFIVVEGGWEFNLSDLSPAEPPQTIEQFGRTYRLDDGPGTAVLTPDQIAAQIAEAVKAEREQRVALERRVTRAADAILNISTDAMRGDNLAVTLCSHFESADDETEVGENGWSEAVTDAYEDVRKEIKRLVDEAIRARGETA